MTPDLTPREFDVMSVLWELGEASVAEVREQLADPLAYTSVLTVLQLLERKGHVAHRRVGRRYAYTPVTSTRDAGDPLLDRMLESLYRHSPARLVAHLVDREGITRDELRQIQELVERRLDGGEGEA